MSSQEGGLVHLGGCTVEMGLKWKFDITYIYIWSPVFTHGSQSYKFRVCRSPGYFTAISLYRKGPSCMCPERSVRWWAGVKKPDGTCHHTYETGILDFQSESEDLYCVAKLLNISEFQLEGHNLAPEGLMTFSFRFLPKLSSVAIGSSVYSVSDMFLREDHRIQVDKSHMYTEVSWEFDLPRNHVSSIAFIYGRQSYQVWMHISHRSFYKRYYISLYRLGPGCVFPERTVRWWSGLKRPDGAYHHICQNGTLYMRSESKKFYEVAELITFVEPDLKVHNLAPEGRLTFFLRLFPKTFSLDADNSVYDITDVPTWGDGKLQIETCQFHMVLYWEIHFEPFREKHFCLLSPGFNLGRQQYRLELTRLSDISTPGELNLYRLGPSEEEDFEWWVGLKRADGFYSSVYENGQLALKLDCQLSTKMKTLKRFETSDLMAMHMGQDGNLTVVFLLRGNSRRSTAGDACIHSVNHMLPKVDGLIMEEERPSHKEIVWNVHCRTVLNDDEKFVSPVFTLRNQHYLLELSLVKSVCLSLNLIRMGPSEEGSTFWLTGLKCADGTRYKRTESKNLKLRQNCEIWTKVGSLKTVALSELDAENLIKDDYVKFFVRLSTDKESNLFNPGAPKLFGCSEESFREISVSYFKQIEWDVNYETSPGNWSLTSPIFELLNHFYMFELSCQDGFWQLHLLSGPNRDGIQQFFIFCTGLKCSNGTYNHRIERGKFNLWEYYYIWRRAHLLKQVSLGELEREHLSPNGIVTFFIRIPSPHRIPKLDIAIVPTLGEGTVEIQEWSSSVHMEWVVDHPKKNRSVTSPEIMTGNQCYLLEMSVEPDAIHLVLYRKGPQIPDVKKARCWAGLRRGDGSYYYRNLRGNLKLNTEWKTWSLVKRLCEFKTLELERNLLSPSAKLTAFLRLSLDRSSEAFINHPSLLSNQGDGIIREDEGICSKELEWTTDFVSDQEDCLSASHHFTLGKQHFLLQLTVDTHKSEKYAVVNLFRFGPYASRNILWWAGQKRADGSYYYKVESGELEVGENFEMWRWQCLLWRVEVSDLKIRNVVVDGKIVVFLRLIQATAEASFSRSVELSVLGTGTIRQDWCTTHTEVEWKIRDVPQGHCWSISSPEFEIGNQRYLLEISKIVTSNLYLKIYRMGPSLDSSVQFWAGQLKSYATYYRRIESGTFCLKDNFEMWTEVKRSNHILNRKHCSPFQCIIFFLDVEPPSSELENCNQGSVDDGNIQIEECSTHTFVEWNIDYDPRKCTQDWSLTSSHFGIENQQYLLKLSSFSYTIAELSLYRMGPSVDGPPGSVRWWSGMNCRDATKVYRNRSGELDLTTDCGVWKKVKRLRIVDPDELNLKGNLCFSFWLGLQQPSNSSDECIHASRVMEIPRYGRIEEEEWTSCKKVEWQIDYLLMSTGERILTSPEISIRNRRFILEFSSVELNWVVHLFRRETTQDGPAKWCLGVRRFAGLYDHDQSISGTLDFEKSCDVWTQVEGAHLFLSEDYKLDKMTHLTITFVLLWDRVSTNTQVDDDIKVPSNSHYLESGDIVFKVQDKEFKEHMAVLSIRVPVLEAMFRLDTVEKRTGVVNIEDCDPNTFERFLKFVGTEEFPAMSTSEIFELFTLADKYLMQSLKYRCLKEIKYDSLRVDTICDLLELISRCEALDLSESVAKFHTQHMNNAKDGAWKNFQKANSEIAFNLQNGDLRALISSKR